MTGSDPHNIDQHTPGAKLDAGKIRPRLILHAMPRAIRAVMDIAQFGAIKYSVNGWQHVPDGIDRYTDAMLRHILAEALERHDPESRMLHAAHTAWNALARLELILRAEETETTP